MKCSRYAPVVGMVVATLVGAAWGSYDYVGSGENFAKVLVEFSDGAVVAFGVSFTDPSTTGIDMMDIIEADSTLTTERVYYGASAG